MGLLEYESKFANLKMNTRGGGEKSPHKVAMLLAVIDLIENESIVENQLYFNQHLKDKFTRHFLELAGPGDRDNPHLPFFHLRSSSFWHHQIKPGRSNTYTELSTASGPGAIFDNIVFAYLDDELFELLSFGTARELLRAALYRNLNEEDRKEILDVGDGWDWLECEAVVADYFEMLHLELSGVGYSKAGYRRALQTKLNNRSEGSIEYKHQNISAVLLELGQPYIRGYKPAYNYQRQLKNVVLAHIAGHQNELDVILDAAESEPPEVEAVLDWEQVLDIERPERIENVQPPEQKFLARKTNFSERESRNRILGERGEKFVIEYERFRLRQAGRDDLAEEVEWSSKERGDGLGYDVRSFSESRDEERFIEVKTTNSGKYQPFFVSDNEVTFSKEFAQKYTLYRVYDFKHQARIFQLPGAIDNYVNLQSRSFLASFN